MTIKTTGFLGSIAGDRKEVGKGIKLHVLPKVAHSKIFIKGQMKGGGGVKSEQSKGCFCWKSCCRGVGCRKQICGIVQGQCTLTRKGGTCQTIFLIECGALLHLNFGKGQREIGVGAWCWWCNNKIYLGGRLRRAARWCLHLLMKKFG